MKSLLRKYALLTLGITAISVSPAVYATENPTSLNEVTTTAGSDITGHRCWKRYDCYRKLCDARYAAEKLDCLGYHTRITKSACGCYYCVDYSH
ncbi:MAG: hypothetical protein NXI04_22120 [Planctomycetaceae bacterium]|nr:hypothetical protein [Planctomycetaceae bacterium]